MAPIAMERTWHYDDSRFVPMQADVAATTRHLLWMMVQEMKGVFMTDAPVKWTVVESCDGVQVAEEDLWTDATKIIRATTGPRSWMVLTNGAIFCTIEANQNTDVVMFSIALSVSKPTGGGVQQAPSAPESTARKTTTGLFPATNMDHRVHARMDQFGSVWIGYSRAGIGFVASWAAIMKLGSPPLGDEFPWALGGASTTMAPGAMRYVEVAHPNTWLSLAPNLAAPVSLQACGASLGVSSTYVLAKVAANPADGTIPRYLVPMKGITAGYEHGRGYLPDWYLAPSEYPQGAMMPAYPDPPQFALFGDIWLPSAAVPIF